MKAVRFILPVLAIIVTVALSGLVSRAESLQVKMDGYPASGQVATVKLIDAGAAPRRALRYSIKSGYTGTAVMSMSADTVTQMGGNSMPMSLPTMVLTTEMAATGVTPEGDVNIAIKIANTAVEGGAGDMIAQMMQQALGMMNGVTGSMTLTPRGVTKSFKFNTESIGEPLLAQAMAQTTSGFDSMTTPFPEEAIGVGARWEVRQAVANGPMTVFQASIFEVTALNGPEVTLKVTSEQTAPPQVVSGLVPGMDAQLEHHSAKGTGTVSMRLDGLVPTAELTLKMSNAMSLDMGGGTQQVATEGTTRITLKPAK